MQLLACKFYSEFTRGLILHFFPNNAYCSVSQNIVSKQLNHGGEKWLRWTERSSASLWQVWKQEVGKSSHLKAFFKYVFKATV
jgi:hypothetical protein